MSKDRIRYLFFRHYEKTASPHEQAELMNLIRTGAYHDELKTLIREALEKEKGDYRLSDRAAEQMLSNIIGTKPESGSIRDTPFEESVEPVEWSENREFGGFSWISKVAAAAAIILASFIGYNFWNKNADKPATAVSGTAAPADLLPGTDKAYLSLADGTNVNLESSDTEPLLLQRGISNDPGKGELTYRKTHAASGYNTLRTPLGGQYKLVLPDGSRAWLNAGSMLKFPNTFEKDKRRVEMSGEVYFEIARDAAKPFIVAVKGTSDHKETEVKVLGTHFNISSYSDEPQIRTTLLEGSVEIKREGVSKRLQPGQQARIQQRAKEPGISVANVKASSTVAWKEGRFEFNDNIKDIMRQIARWYDVKIRYEGNVGDKSFAGVIPRGKHVSEVLKMLELTGGIHFTIEDRTIVVKAASN